MLQITNKVECARDFLTPQMHTYSSVHIIDASAIMQILPSTHISSNNCFNDSGGSYFKTKLNSH
jgi:hypothetical protein